MSDYPFKKSESEWKEQLGSERYKILRDKGTEFPHSGKYNLTFDKGTYCCGACGEPLFNSDSKFKSSCGWPSFDESIPGKIEYIQDRSFGMLRTEIVCANCGSHLGHVFDDGPTETGQRYCVNSASVDLKEE
ncbi:MAG: peptide-methionine (R)-S-oxide reductase MsrB [Flavobacterium sp.]